MTGFSNSQQVDMDISMSLSRDQQQRRAYEVPDVIRNLAKGNVAINDCLHRYTLGHIVTEREMLCQMIVILDNDWRKQTEAYIQFRQMTTSPLLPSH